MMDVILMKHEGGKVMTKLACVEPRAPGIMTHSATPSLELRAGSVVTKSVTHLCDNYSMEREMTVLQVTGNIIKVRDVTRYVGSTAGCRHPQLPSNCHHEAITTWVLARSACDARCDASYDGHWSYGEGDPAPAIDAVCSCP